MKQKAHTPFITGLLRKSLGSESNHDHLPVFEVVATSSRPLKKKGIYQDARITPLTLAQMSQWVSKEAIPLMMDHNMEGTPKGKLFYAQMHEEGPDLELRGLFYIDPTETELVAKANNGTVDETSVGFLPSAIKCSICGFDYMAALKAENYEPLMTLTCDQGHKIGTSGVHAVVDGLADFMELSLVSRGAAPYSKIIGSDHAKLGLDIEKLTASGYDVNELYLTASASQGDNGVDISELINQLTEVKATAAVDKLTLTAKVEAAEAAAATAAGRVTELEAQIATLQTELEAAKNEVKPSEDAEALKAAQDFLAEQYVAVLSAAGESEITAPEAVQEVIEGIKANRAKLSAIYPVGGVATAAGGGQGDKEEVPAHLAAFKRK